MYDVIIRHVDDALFRRSRALDRSAIPATGLVTARR